MKNYLLENSTRYQNVGDRVVDVRAETKYGGTDYADFSSRGFLKDVIPEAIMQARRNASARGVDAAFEVMDVTRIPHGGPAYDLIVDSYCLQGIVLDADRDAVFRAVKARLDPRGYYLVSTAMYEAARHRPDHQVADRGTGRTFDGYDEDCLYEPDTDLLYQPYDGEVAIDGAITVNGNRFVPARRYRNGPRLRKEVESYGFEVLHQTGEWGENLAAVHRGSAIRLSSMA